MGRKGNKSTTKSEFKSGDLVLISYKKFSTWPCIVKCVYPKKITYNFLPITEKAAVFSADNKAVKAFSVQALEDYTGPNTEEYEKACAEAMLIFNKGDFSNNVFSEKINNKLNDEETSDDSMSNNSEKIIKQNNKETNNESEATISDSEKPINLVKETFSKGDAVLVRCENGMWPAAFCIYKENEAIIHTFPLEENEESLVNVKDVFELSRDAMDDFHSSNSNDNDLIKAMKSVETYWNKEQNVKSNSFSKIKQNNKKNFQKLNSKKTELNKQVNKKKNLETQKKNLETLKDKGNNNSSNTVGTKEEVSINSNASEKVLKNKIFDELEKASALYLNARPKRAFKKDVSLTIDKTKSLKKEENIVLPNIEEKNNMPIYESISTDIHREDPSKNLIINRKRRAVEVMNNRTVEAFKTDSKKVVNKRVKKDPISSLKPLEHSPVVITDEDVKQSEKAKLVQEWLQNSVVIARTTENSLVKKMESNFADLILSNEANEFMSKIWKNYTQKDFCENPYFCLPKSEEELKFEFKTGNLLSPAELEKSISTIFDWITLCTILPRMNLLVQLRYVVNFVLPELCIFGISKNKKVSLKEARKLFEERKLEQMNSKNINGSLSKLIPVKGADKNSSLHKDITNIRDSSIPSSSAGKNIAMECLILAATLEAEKNENSANIISSNSSAPVELPEMTGVSVQGSLSNKRKNNR